MYLDIDFFLCQYWDHSLKLSLSFSCRFWSLFDFGCVWVSIMILLFAGTWLYIVRLQKTSHSLLQTLQSRNNPSLLVAHYIIKHTDKATDRPTMAAFLGKENAQLEVNRSHHLLQNMCTYVRRMVPSDCWIELSPCILHLIVFSSDLHSTQPTVLRILDLFWVSASLGAFWTDSRMLS